MAFEIDIELSPATYNIDLVVPFVEIGSGAEWGSITGILSDQEDLQAELDTRIEEAPVDGNQYARKDGAWSEVESSGGGGFTQQTLTDGATVTWDVSAGNQAFLTKSVDGTLSFPTNINASDLYMINVKQGIGGNHSIEFSDKYIFPDGIQPDQSVVEGVTDVYLFKADNNGNLLLISISSSLGGITNGLDLWIKLDGDSHDLSGNYNDGIDADVTYVQGVNQEVADYTNDGYTDFGVSLGNFGTDDFTAMCWVKFDDFTQSLQGIVGKSTYAVTNTRWHITKNNSNILFTRGSTNFNYPISNISEGDYVHFALVSKNGNGLCYVNGAHVGSTGSAFTPLINTNALFVGGFQNADGITLRPNTSLQGVISDVRIYSKALTQAAIQGIMAEENY